MEIEIFTQIKMNASSFKKLMNIFETLLSEFPGAITGNTEK